MRTITLYKFNELSEDAQEKVVKRLLGENAYLRDDLRKELSLPPPQKIISLENIVYEKLEEILNNFEIDRKFVPPKLNADSHTLFVDFKLSLDSIRRLNEHYNLLFDNEMVLLIINSHRFSRKRSPNGIEIKFVNRAVKARGEPKTKEDVEAEVFEKMKNIFDKLHTFLSGMEKFALHQISTAILDGTFQKTFEQKLETAKAEKNKHDQAFRDSITSSSLEFYEDGSSFGDIYEPEESDERFW